MLELQKNTLSELQDYKNGMSGTLRLGTMSAIDATLLNERLIRFNKKYPGIRYEVYEGITPEIIELLRSGVIEVGVVRTPYLSDGLDIRYLEPEPMIAAYCSDFTVGREGSEFVTIEELKGLPLTIYRRFEAIIYSVFRQHELEPDVFCINDDSRTTLLWANAGLGIAIVPYTSLSLVMGQNLRYKRIDEPSLTTRVTAITLKNGFLSAAARNFLTIFG